MKKMSSKIISVVLAVSMIFSVIISAGVSVSAATEKVNEGFENYTYDTFTLSNGTNSRGETIKVKSNRNYFGQRMSITDEDAYSGHKALKYKYVAAADVDNTNNAYTDNMAKIAALTNNTNYVATFKYKISEGAKTNVKFSINNGGSSNVNTYRKIYTTAECTVDTAEEETGVWQTMTLFFKSSFAATSGSMLYLLINPAIQKDVTVYVDDLVVTAYTSSDAALVLCGDQHGRTTLITGTAGSTVTLPVLSSEEYDFGGWVTTQGGSTAYTSTTLPASFTVAYAKWSQDADKVITFDNYAMPLQGDGKYRRSANIDVTDEVLYNGHKTVKYDPVTYKTPSDNYNSYTAIGDTNTGYALAGGYKYIITVKYLFNEPISAGYLTFSAAHLDNVYANGVGSSALTHCCNGNEAVGVWHEYTDVIDLSSVSGNKYLYMSARQMSGAPLYIGEVSVKQVAANQGIVICETGATVGATKYYVGNPGASYSPATPVARDGSAFIRYGIWGNADLTYNSTVIGKSSGTVGDTTNGKNYLTVQNFIFTNGVYRITPLFAENNKVEGFEQYEERHQFDIYASYCSLDKDYEIYKSDKEGNDPANVYEGKSALHRIGDEPYLANAVLLDEGNRLIIGRKYTMSMKVKMDKYAQSNGAIRFVCGNNPTYPWSTYNLTGEVAGWGSTSDERYEAIVPIASLTDGEWHTVSYTFEAKGLYVNLQTPGYCSLFIDDVRFTDTNAAVSSSVPFNAYTQAWLDNPVYVYGKDAANLDFEDYEFTADMGKKISLVNDAKSGNFAVKYTRTRGDDSSDILAQSFKLKKLKDNQVYKISFWYKASDLTTNVNVNFATADGADIKTNTALYTDKGEYFTVTPDTADGSWHQAKVYISAALTATVENDSFTNTDDCDKLLGDTLYAYITAENDVGASVVFDKFEVTEAANAVGTNGVAALTSAAAQTAGCQALRYYFFYNSVNGNTVYYDGMTLTVKERGIVLVNGKNSAGTVTADGSYKVVAPVASGDAYYKTVKTSAFNECWQQTQDLTIFSTYIKGLTDNDARDIKARAYVVFTDVNGNEYTFYSKVVNNSVEKVLEKNTISSSSKNVHTFDAKAFSSFKIIVPNVSSYIVTEAADQLKAYADKYVGSAVTKTTDYLVSNNTNQYEILIGETNRAATTTAKTKISGDGYVIYMVNAYKLAIVGNSDAATRAGVLRFIDLLKKYDALNKGYYLANGAFVTGEFNPTERDYQLTYSDEFNGTALDTTVWGDYTSSGYNLATSGGTSCYGGTVKTYGVSDYIAGTTITDKAGNTVRPIEVSNGTVKARATRTTTNDFVGSEISSWANMNWKYGFLEIKSKLPEAPACVTLWANSTVAGSPIEDKYPELGRRSMIEYDFLENFGYYNYFAVNWHRWINGATTWSFNHNSMDYNNVNNFTNVNNGRATLNNQSRTVGLPYKNWADPTIKTDMGLSTSLPEDFHIYTLFYNEKEATMALDGKVVLRYVFTDNTSTSVFRQSTQLIFGAHMGSSGYGVNCKEYEKTKVYPNVLTHEVDYIRLYQMPESQFIYR